MTGTAARTPPAVRATIADLDAPTRRALAYAAAFAARVVAVRVDTRVNERAEESEHIVNRLLAWKRHARAEGREDPVHQW
jgi:hypothetical protein